MTQDLFLITSELWIIFFSIIGISISIDLGLIGKIRSKFGKTKESTVGMDILHEMPFKQALAWAIVWISLAGIFAVIISFSLGQEKMIEFVTGYTLEKSLSVDNMFVFLLIFTTLGIPHKYQHKVLSIGILSAIAMRIGIILVGHHCLRIFIG